MTCRDTLKQPTPNAHSPTHRMQTTRNGARPARPRHSAGAFFFFFFAFPSAAAASAAAPFSSFFFFVFLAGSSAAAAAPFSPPAAHVRRSRQQST